MFFTDRFNYREHATAIHRERIKLEQTAYRGFSSILLIDAITALNAAIRLTRAMLPAKPPTAFQRGGIISNNLGGEFIIPKHPKP